MKRFYTILLSACMAFSLGACDALGPRVEFPTNLTIKPQAIVIPPANPTGSIYHVATYRPMFEDRRARMVGDTITIIINEKVSSTQNNATSASKSDSASISIPIIQSLFGSGNDLKALSGSASSSKKFDGKGASTANNLMTGILTATVKSSLALTVRLST
jgi:flagellar L-ring protein FlgH